MFGVPIVVILYCFFIAGSPFCPKDSGQTRNFLATLACRLVDKEETRRFFFLAESQTNLRRAVKKRYSTISFRANLYAEIASTEWAVKAELHIRVRFITTIFAYPNVASVQSAIWAECKNSLSKIYVTSFLIARIDALFTESDKRKP